MLACKSSNLSFLFLLIVFFDFELDFGLVVVFFSVIAIYLSVEFTVVVLFIVFSS